MKLTMFHSRPGPACIHHEIRSASESSLLLTACNIVSTTSPVHRPHPSFVELAVEPKREDGWRTPAHLLEHLSFTPSWAFSIPPQQQSLQETGGEITGPLWEHAWPSRSFPTATSVTKECRCRNDSLQQAQSDIKTFSQKMIFWSRAVRIEVMRQ